MSISQTVLSSPLANEPGKLVAYPAAKDSAPSVGAFKHIHKRSQGTLVLRTVYIRARQAEHDVHVLEQAEAMAKLDSIKRDCQKLSGAFGQLLKVLGAKLVP